MTVLDLFTVVGVDLGSTVAAGVGGYLTFVLRKLHKSLDRQDKHEKALFGDPDLDFPGVIRIATKNRERLDDGE